MHKNILFILIISLIISSCSTRTTTTIMEQNKETIEIATDTVKQLSPTELAFLEAGKIVHEYKCERCHEIHTPETFTKTEWTYWVNEMAPKAKLTEDEKHQLETYLHHYAKTK